PSARDARDGVAVPSRARERARGLAPDDQLDRDGPVPAFAAVGDGDRTVLPGRSRRRVRSRGGHVMTKTMPRGMRAATSAGLPVGGGAIAAATWISGDHGFAVAVVVFYLVAAGVAWLWSGGKGDVAAIMRVG